MRRLAVPLTSLLTLLTLPLIVYAQETSVTADSSIERRELQRERRDRPAPPPALVRAAGAETPPRDNFFRLTPSLTSTDGSTKTTFAAPFVSATEDGRFYFSIRPSYRQSRPRTDDNTHRNGYGIGADVQLTSDNNRYGQFIVSGDYVNVENSFQLALSTLEFDHALGKYFTVVASASLGRLAPESGERVSDVIPALELDLTPPKTGLRLIGSYTFDNDVDGEDDYEGGVRFSVGEKAAVRFALGKGGRVSAGLVITVKR